MNTARTVRESMSRSLITINWKETMSTAHERMCKLNMRHLPVVNDLGEVVGMLSDRDVKRAMHSRSAHEARPPSAWGTAEFDAEARVRDFMGWPVLSVEQTADLKVVALQMLHEKVSSVLVTNGGQTVGIVTTDDLLEVLIELLDSSRSSGQWSLSKLLSDGARHLTMRPL